MARLRRTLAVIGAAAAVVGMTTAGASAMAQTPPRPADTILAGSGAAFTAHTPVIGNVAGSQRLSIELWLKPNLAAATRFATAVSTPGSAMFHRYVSPAGYAARFGATRAAASRVESWLRSEGFTAVHTDAQRTYVRATAATSRIDAAFRVRLRLYQSSATVNAGRYRLRANDRPVSVPSSLAGSILGVTGLDNAAPILPLDRPSDRPGAATSVRAASGGNPACSRYYGQHKVTGLPEQFGTTTFPTEVCGYSARQLRAGYRASMANTGRGQTIALVELGLTGQMFRTLRDYATANHMPAPSGTRYAELSLGRNTCGDPFFIEEQIDVESSYDMAPGAHQLVVGGDSCNFGDFGLQGLFNADITVLNGSGGHPLATIASNSWESGDEDQAPALTNIEHAFLVRAAAEGVGMYFSSADGSGTAEPSSDPFAIAVGGTTLGLGKTGNRLFETGWSTGESILSKNGQRWIFLGEQGAAGGGPSLLWRKPSYQNGVVPRALTKPPAGNRGGPVRSVPDIGADADPFTGMAVGLLTSTGKGQPLKFVEVDFGGTSLAAPLVAGMVTAAQAGRPAAFGFLDPAIYKLAGTNAYFGTLPLTGTSPMLYRGTACDQATCGAQVLTTFDDQNPHMGGYTGQVTLPGYDNMTGVGTPNGPKFIVALRSLEG
jgi:subtilase family serine protease